jgi:hypothetical protein
VVRGAPHANSRLGILQKARRGAGLDELLVAVLQVDEVGGGDPREMADFGGAFAAEIEGWAAEEWVYGGLRGAAQPAGTLGRGVPRWIGEWRL